MHKKLYKYAALSKSASVFSAQLKHRGVVRRNALKTLVDPVTSITFVKALRLFTQSVASAVVAINTFVVLIKGETREDGEETETEMASRDVGQDGVDSGSTRNRRLPPKRREENTQGNDRE